GVSRLCQREGSGFAACTSPKGYSGLTDGSHSFQVKARDAASNDSTVTTRSWTVDTTAPLVALTAPANGSSTSDPTPTLSGTAGMAAGDASAVTVWVYSGSGTGGALVETLSAPRQLDGSYSVDAS